MANEALPDAATMLSSLMAQGGASGSSFSPELKRNPFPMYAAARKMQPVVYVPPFDAWCVFSYEDAKTVLSDFRRFSSNFGGEADDEADGPGRSVITTDPPRHTKLRALVSRAFTPQAVRRLEPAIRGLAEEMLSEVSSEMDLIEDLAYPLPVLVIAQMLGVPKARIGDFKRWSDAVVESADSFLSGESEGAEQAHQEMGAFFHEVIAERRRAPREDLISHLIEAEVDGERLAEEDIIAFCWLLLVAGNETTTNLIGNAVLTLLEEPETLRRLRQDPSLIPDALEEVLRFRSPIQAMFRRSAQEVTLSGKTIPAGSAVVAWIGSANRDGEKFPEPDRFLIDRRPNPHIAFGQGIHFCLGAPLARLEAKVAMEVLLKRFSSMERSGEGLLPPAKGVIIHGVLSLPLKVAV